jgi:hypothetical protein
VKSWGYVMVTLAAPQLWALVVARALAAWERRQQRLALRRAGAAHEDFRI